jgi:hypothetical protein
MWIRIRIRIRNTGSKGFGLKQLAEGGGGEGSGGVESVPTTVKQPGLLYSLLILVHRFTLILHLIDKGSLAALAEYFGWVEADVSHPDVPVGQLHRQGRRLIRRAFPTNRT